MVYGSVVGSVDPTGRSDKHFSKKPQTRFMKKLTKRDGRPESKSIRWSFQQAERETGLGRDTFIKRARSAGIEPGPDGCYSTRQILALIHGDREAETIANILEDTRGKRLKNDIAEGALIYVELVIRLAESFLVPVRQRILSSGLSDEEKAEMLEDLVGMGEVDWSAEAVKA